MSIFSQILYALSGFFFGTFCCRYGVISIAKFRSELSRPSSVNKAIRLCIRANIVVILWIIAPMLMIARSQIGGYTMVITIIYFANKARKLGYYR